MNPSKMTALKAMQAYQLKRTNERPIAVGDTCWFADPAKRAEQRGVGMVVDNIVEVVEGSEPRYMLKQFMDLPDGSVTNCTLFAAASELDFGETTTDEAALLVASGPMKVVNIDFSDPVEKFLEDGPFVRNPELGGFYVIRKRHWNLVGGDIGVVQCVGVRTYENEISVALSALPVSGSNMHVHVVPQYAIADYVS